MALDPDAMKTVMLDPELVTRFWQDSAMRLMRANERILHGLMKAANREMEIAQELAQYNLGKFSSFSRGAGAGKVTAADGQAQFEHIVTGLREVSQDLWKTFGDASKMLMEGSLTGVPEPFAEPLRKSAQQAEAAVKQFSAAVRK